MSQRSFSPEGGFMKILYKISDLFFLNILWILFSIPVVTVGASTTALYTVTMKMARDEESYIFRSFLQAFKENFKQATIIWLIYAIAGGILYFNLYVAATGKIFAQGVFLTIFTIMGIFYIIVGIFLFPVLSRFDTNILQIIKIAAYLSFRHIGYTILTAFIIFIPFLAVAAYLYLLPVLIIIAGSGSAYITSFILNKIFLKYVPARK